MIFALKFNYYKQHAVVINVILEGKRMRIKRHIFEKNLCNINLIVFKHDPLYENLFF